MCIKSYLWIVSAEVEVINHFFYNYCFTRRSSRSEMFFEVGVLKNFAIFTGKHLEPLFIKLQACNFINKRLQHRCFPVNSAKFLKTPISKITSSILDMWS